MYLSGWPFIPLTRSIKHNSVDAIATSNTDTPHSTPPMGAIVSRGTQCHGVAILDWHELSVLFVAGIGTIDAQRKILLTSMLHQKGLRRVVLLCKLVAIYFHQRRMIWILRQRSLDACWPMAKFSRNLNSTINARYVWNMALSLPTGMLSLAALMSARGVVHTTAPSCVSRIFVGYSSIELTIKKIIARIAHSSEFHLCYRATIECQSLPPPPIVGGLYAFAL